MVILDNPQLFPDTMEITALDYFYPDGKDKAVEIEKEVVEKLKELFGIKMDCLFYDVTSTYFEGTKCIIARLGYSRDGKPDM